MTEIQSFNSEIFYYPINSLTLTANDRLQEPSLLDFKICYFQKME